MIVLCHVSVALLPGNSSVERMFGQSLEMLGSFGNSAFFLIAGYFTGKGTVNLPRLKKIFIPVFSYTMISVLAYLIYYHSLPSWTPVQFFYNLLTGGLGFVQGYFIIQLVGKFMIKKYLNLRPRSQIIIIILSMSVTLTNVILNSFFDYMPIISQIIPPGVINYGLNYFWVFLVGATLKNHRFHLSNVALLAIGTIILILNAIISPDKLLGIMSNGVSFYLIASTIIICIFQVLADLNIPFNQNINNFAKLTYGIYIVHFAFGSPIAFVYSANSPLTQYVINHQIPLMPWVLFMTVSVILISALIEYFRQKIFTRLPFQRLLN